MPKRINLNWLFALAGLAWLADLFLPHVEHVYRNDPGSILISLAISAAVTGAQYGIQTALTKRVKPNPIDKGKADDFRISAPGYGVSLPWARGTFRTAPVWFWHTPIVHSTVTTPGQSGGKGPPKPPTPDTIEHRYTTSLAGAIHDGIIYKGVSRIWFNADLVFNANLANNFADTDSTRYEAEHAVLAGGAAVAAQAECSGGNKVTGIGSGGTATIHCDVATTGSYELAVFYTSTTQRTFKVSVNGGATVDLVCPASGGANMVRVEMLTRTLNAGANTIAFSNAGAACPDLDAIDITPALVFVPGGPSGGEDRRSFTGLITPGLIPSLNQDIQWATANELPTFSDTTTGGAAGGGFYTATLSKWGNPSIRIYPGSETQEPDPAIIADKGADAAPAYRGVAYLVIDSLLLPSGQLPNVTVEVNQGVREAATIVQDVYEAVGVPRADVDVSALAGKIIGSAEGFNPGTYGAITWTGLVNTTQTGGGAITKTSGTNNSWNAYANSGNTVSAGTDAAVRFTARAGTFLIGFSTSTTPQGPLPGPYNVVKFGVLLNLNSNPSQENKLAIQMSLGGFTNSFDVGVWAVGDVFQVEIRNGRFAAYQNGLLLTGFSPPVPTFPLFPVFAGYAVGGGVSAASFASGANIGSEPIVANAGALILESQKQASELIVDMQTRFQFDVPEVDGKIKVVLRAGTSEFTITESELRARRRGEELPLAAAKITDGNPIDLPFKVEISYLDPQLDYHNNTQSDRRLVAGPQQNVVPLALSMVETAANMQNLAVLIRQRAICENRKFTFTTGPKYMKLHQGAILTLVLLNATHTLRITDMRFDLPAGLCEFGAVRHAASLYTPNAAGHPGGGTEKPVVPIPGATRGVFIDSPLIEPEHAGDEPKSLLYVAMAGRGSGTWPGGFLNREFPAASGIYELVTHADKPATIGKTTAALASVADPTVLDTTSVLTVDFYADTGTIESATLAQIQNNPKLNLLWVARTSDGEGEYLQFQTATPQAASAPFVARYQFTNLLRGRYNTHGNVGIHQSGDDVVLMNSAVKVLPMETARLGVPWNYQFVTSGADPDDAAVVSNTWRGYSLKPLPPTDLDANRDSSNDWHIAAVGHPREPERPESYIARLRRNSDGVILRDVPIRPGLRMAAILDHIIHADGGGTWSSGTHAIIDHNNVIGEDAETAAYVTQPFMQGGEINARVLVTPAPAPFLTGKVRLSFGPDDFTDPFGIITGAILNTKNDNDTTLTQINVFDWSTSQQVLFDLPTVGGVVFVRVVWSGTELRWQFSADPINPATPPNVIIKDVAPTDPTFFRISLANGGPLGASAAKVENITIGGLSTPQTIYSLPQQENDNSGSGIAPGNLDVELWQVSRYGPDFKGFSIRKVF